MSSKDTSMETNEDEDIKSQNETTIKCSLGSSPESSLPEDVEEQTLLKDSSSQSTNEDDKLQKEKNNAKIHKILEKVRLPPINCKERIIIVLDTVKDEIENNFPSYDKHKTTTPLDALKQALFIFLKLKSSINPNHEYALIELKENHTVWSLDFTKNIKKVLEAVDNVEECAPEDFFNLNTLFKTILDNVNLPIKNENLLVHPPYIIRTILLYKRSYTRPQINFTPKITALLNSPYFTFDILVSHEPIDVGNHCKEIVSILTNINKNGFSYMFSVARDFNALFTSMGRLLGHPLQRSPQISVS